MDFNAQLRILRLLTLKQRIRVRAEIARQKQHSPTCECVRCLWRRALDNNPFVDPPSDKPTIN